MAKPEWITIGTVEGSMNGSSEITAAAHTGRVAREGNITVTTAGGVTDTTAVSQVGAAEVIIVDKLEYAATAIGQNVTIHGRSNSANLVCRFDTADGSLPIKLAVAGVTDESWNGFKDTTVDGDPGSSAIYNFTLTVTVPENKSESAREFKSVVMNAVGDVYSEEVKITQAAGVKNYSKPVVSGFVYSLVEAFGRDVYPESSLQITQQWGWNESKTNGGTIVSPIFSDTYPIISEYIKVSGADGVSVNNDNGVVTVPSKGTVVSDRTTVATVRLNLTINGVAADPVTATVEQDANTITYGEITIGQATPVSLAASGETYQIVPALKQTVTYTSGVTRTEATPADNKVQLSANYAVKTAKEGFSLEANTGKVTVSPNPASVPREGFVVTISAAGEGGKTATKDITFYQLGSASTISISPDTLSFIAAGETKTVTITSNDSWTLS